VNPSIPHQKKEMALYINHHLKSSVSVTLPCQLLLMLYTLVGINNHLKSTSAIKVATMKKYRHFKRKPSYVTAKSALFTVSKG